MSVVVEPQKGCGNGVAAHTEPEWNCKEMDVHGQMEGKATGASRAGALKRVANVVFLSLLAALFVASGISVIAGALCLASLSGLPFARFPMFYFMGVAPTVVGVLVFAISVCVVAHIAFGGAGVARYGMGFVGRSRPRQALYVLLHGVLPFIVFLALLGLSILGFSFYSLSRQAPSLDKNYVAVPGITGPVDIVRDKDGLVHIKAQSRRDAYFGQGFAEAQDRLFQMEFYRLVGRGELASVVGVDGIKSDKVMRVLNLKAAAASLCKNADPKDLSFLEAFVEGVNYYLQHESARPVEFFFMSSRPLYFHEPQPFSVDDICVITRLLQFQLTAGTSNENKRLSMFFTEAQRGYDGVESLFDDIDGVENTILTAKQLNLTENDIKDNKVLHRRSRGFEKLLYDSLLAFFRQFFRMPTVSGVYNTPQTLVRNSVKQIMSKRFFLDEEADIFGNKRLHASNAWMARDSNNNTVGASDPHLGLEFPSVWYFTHLSFPDDDGKMYDTAGVAMVGLPGVHIGKTTYVSWGITFSMTDLEDIFLLANIKADNKPFTSYTYREKVRKFEPRREIIAVRGGDDVVLDLEDTLFGPVVNSLLKVVLPPVVKFALYSVPLRQDDKDSISIMLSLSDPAVRTAYQLMSNLRKLPCPGFSIPISDRDGNIAYTVTGRHPMRAFGHTGKYPNLIVSIPPENKTDLDGLASFFNPPKTGVPYSDTYVSDDPNVADVFIPTEKNPHFYSPADGTPMHISAANQKIYPDGYAYEFGFDYDWPYRGRRLQELLQKLLNESSGQLSNISRHMDIQLDIKSNIWDQDVRAIVQSFNVTNESAATKMWHKKLMDWDGRASVGSQETAFFWRWLQTMLPLPLDVPQSFPRNRYLVRLLTKPDRKMQEMCHGYAKMIGLTVASCTELGLATFRQLASTDFQERWGIDLNRLTGIHKMLHEKILRPVFERTINKDGDFSSLCVSGHSLLGDMASSQASSVRLIYDMRNPDSIFFALPGGASGNPYSEFYQNLLERFSKGEYAEVAASAAGLDTLLSKGSARHHQVLFPTARGATANASTP